MVWLKYLALSLFSLLKITRGRKEDNACPFCEVTNKEGYRTLYADEVIAVFLSSYQVRPGHLLVAPRRHVVSFRELEDSELSQLFSWAQWAARALVEAGMADAINIAVNDGEAAGQTVPHAHVHVLPRLRGDLRLPNMWANPALLLSGTKLSRQTAESLKKKICSASTPI